MTTTTTTDWVEIIVPATAALADEVAALLVDEVVLASAGTEIRGDEVVFWVARADAEAAIAAAQAALAGWDLPDVDPAAVRQASAVPESEWREAWKRYFHVTRLTRQLVVVPSWERAGFVPAVDDRIIDLDPGMAFGTGTHASTRLVLEELQHLVDAHQSGARDYSSPLWTLLMFEAFVRNNGSMGSMGPDSIDPRVACNGDSAYAA